MFSSTIVPNYSTRFALVYLVLSRNSILDRNFMRVYGSHQIIKAIIFLVEDAPMHPLNAVEWAFFSHTKINDTLCSPWDVVNGLPEKKNNIVSIRTNPLLLTFPPLSISNSSSCVTNFHFHFHFKRLGSFRGKEAIYYTYNQPTLYRAMRQRLFSISGEWKNRNVFNAKRIYVYICNI